MMMHGLLLLAGGTLLLGTAAAAQPVEVTLAVTGVQPAGRVMGQVFANAADFKARERPVLRFTIEPQGTTVRTTLSLPPGRYALALFQDTKLTGKIETNFIGSPVVPYGFSNNARGGFGPPSFEAATVVVDAAHAALSVALR